MGGKELGDIVRIVGRETESVRFVVIYSVDIYLEGTAHEVMMITTHLHIESLFVLLTGHK